MCEHCVCLGGWSADLEHSGAILDVYHVQVCVQEFVESSSCSIAV